MCWRVGQAAGWKSSKNAKLLKHLSLCANINYTPSVLLHGIDPTQKSQKLILRQKPLLWRAWEVSGTRWTQSQSVHSSAACDPSWYPTTYKGVFRGIWVVGSRQLANSHRTNGRDIFQGWQGFTPHATGSPTSPRTKNQGCDRRGLRCRGKIATTNETNQKNKQETIAEARIDGRAWEIQYWDTPYGHAACWNQINSGVWRDTAKFVLPARWRQTPYRLSWHRKPDVLIEFFHVWLHVHRASREWLPTNNDPILYNFSISVGLTAFLVIDRQFERIYVINSLEWKD